MKVKKLALLGAFFALLASSHVAVADNPLPEIVGPYLAEDLPSKGIGFVFDDARSRVQPASFLGNYELFYPNAPGIFDPESAKRAYCDSIDDAVCSKAKKFESVAMLPPCVDAKDNYCIDSVYAIINEKKVAGAFVETVPQKLEHTFKGDSKLNLATGSIPSLWKIPGAINGAGNENYIVKVYLEQKSVRNVDGTIQPFSVHYMSLGFYAANPVTGNFVLPQAQNGGGDSFTKFGCSTNSETICERRTSFPEGTRFGVILRFAKPPVSWFYGRLGRAYLDTKIENYGISLTVEGEPVLVPVLTGFSPWDQLPAYLQCRYQQIISSCDEINKVSSDGQKKTGENIIGFGYDGNKGGETNPRNWQFRAVHSSDDFGALKAWIPLVGDKATIMTPQFFLNSVPEDSMGDLGRCFNSGNQVNGLVTSNATAYTPGPPNFNQQDQTLDYQIAAPHYTAGGNIMKGTYDLSIRADVARCIYGFSNAPIKASITVVSENGISNVATENVGEKDGWFRLGAYGFTFSQPKLRVKLTQERAPESSAPAPVAVSSQVTVTPAKMPAKIITIKCVKGKSTKVVTSSAPKCPTGYKKM